MASGSVNYCAIRSSLYALEVNDNARSIQQKYIMDKQQKMNENQREHQKMSETKMTQQ